MRERFMNVAMGMRLAAVPREIVRMSVMGIMHMAMVMRQGLMVVGVDMALGEVQP